MSLLAGALELQDLDAGYWFDIIEGGPTSGVARVSGRRVLIPGRPGFYTPSSNFEARDLLVRLKGTVWGVGSTISDRRIAFRAGVEALKSALAIDTRADVTLTANGPVEGLGPGDSATIAAGFLRFESPVRYGWEAWETIIELEATDPPEWAVVLAS